MRDPSYAALREELEREVRRVADRLRSLPLARLAQPVDGYPSRAAAARAAAQALADAAAELEAEPGDAPVPREVPVLADAAAADVIAVTGTDLLLASAAAEDDPRASRVVAAALEALRQVRRLL